MRRIAGEYWKPHILGAAILREGPLHENRSVLTPSELRRNVIEFAVFLRFVEPRLFCKRELCLLLNVDLLANWVTTNR
jgi:hypothetical protein